MRGRRPRRTSTKPTHHLQGREERDGDIASSLCPSCGRVFDVPLLLPCSHTLCGRCLTQKARIDKRISSLKTSSAERRTVCAVICPRCGHGVELPCFDWSSALRCLPLDPTVSAHPEDEEGAKEETGVNPEVDVELSEEDMERSVSGLLFTLDPSSLAPPLRLTNSALTATCTGHRTQDGSHTGGSLPQVCGDISIHRGQYYWEVDVCNSALYRIGVISLADDEAWWFERRGSAFHVLFDGRRELLPSVPPQLKTVGVFLNVGGASLTFHNPLTQELLAAIPSRFTPPLIPTFQLGQGRLKLRPGLSPPNHVFLSRNSAYRGPEGVGRGRWRRDVAFGSVRTVIQKFEELATSDSDSGLTSSCSSTSRLTPEPNQNPETAAPDEGTSPSSGCVFILHPQCSF